MRGEVTDPACIAGMQKYIKKGNDTNLNFASTYEAVIARNLKIIVQSVEKDTVFCALH